MDAVCAVCICGGGLLEEVFRGGGGNIDFLLINKNM